MAWVNDNQGGQYWVPDNSMTGAAAGGASSGVAPGSPAAPGSMYPINPGYQPAGGGPSPGYTPGGGPQFSPLSYGPVSYNPVTGQPITGPQPNQGPITSPTKSGDPYIDDAYSTARQNSYNIGQRFGQQVQPALNQAQDLNMDGLQWNRFALDEQKAQQQAYGQELNRVQGDQYTNAVNANTNGQNITSRNRAQTDYLNGVDMQALGSFQQGMQPLRAQMQSSGPYQNIGFDPQGLAAQQNALGMMGDIYGGSLDYTAAQAQASHAQAYLAQAAMAKTVAAKLAQYQSNPQDIEEQKKALQGIKGMVNGGEWSDNLRDVRDKYKGLSNPEITDQERFLMENFRQQSEGQMRSNREALGADLGARGIRSGASEQVGLGMYNQQVGQDRVLTELGASANAVGRSMDAMQGWANTSSIGRQAQLQAQGMYIDAAGQMRGMNDNVGMFNADSFNKNQMFNAGETNATNRLNANNQTNVSMQNAAMQTDVSKFNANADTTVSMFNAGERNTASANNQATRLGGAQGYSQAATNLRNSNDTINMFNKDQQMVQERHIDNFNLTDAQRRQSVENDLLTGTTGATGQIGSRSYADNALALGENDRGWERNTAVNDRATANADRTYQAGRDWVGDLQGQGSATTQAGLNKAGIAGAGQGIYLSGLNAGYGQVSDGARLSSGTVADSAALAAAREAEENDPGGLFGTGLLGKNGIFGLKGVKYL